MPESEHDRKQESAALLHFSTPTSPPHDTHLRPPDDSPAALLGEQSACRSLVQAVPGRARTIQAPFSEPLLGSKRASSVPVSTSGARLDVPRVRPPLHEEPTAYVAEVILAPCRGGPRRTLMSLLRIASTALSQLVGKSRFIFRASI